MEKNRLSQISKATKAPECSVSQTPPTEQMELIRPGSKRRVRVISNVVENTPSKQMKVAKES